MVAGVAYLSIAAAMICGGLLVMTGAVALAAVQDSAGAVPDREPVE